MNKCQCCKKSKSTRFITINALSYYFCNKKKCENKAKDWAENEHNKYYSCIIH